MSQTDQERKWNHKYESGYLRDSDPSRTLVELASWIPKHGRALDVAGGAGRNAVWLAQQGLDVTVADISGVGLEMAEQRARNARVSLATVIADLENGPLPFGPWDLVVSVCFLWRPLFSQVQHSLNPRGRLIIVQPTKRNLERHQKPPRQFLLEEGELPTLVGNLNVLFHQEQWSSDQRHDAVLVAENES